LPQWPLLPMIDMDICGTLELLWLKSADALQAY